MDCDAPEVYVGGRVSERADQYTAADSPLLSLMHCDEERLRAGHPAQVERQRHQVVVRHRRHNYVELIETHESWRLAGVRHLRRCLPEQNLKRRR